MNFFEMSEAVEDAKRTMRFADEQTNQLVQLLAGRLKKGRYSYQGAEALKQLKAELKDFDSRSGTWREKT